MRILLNTFVDLDILRIGWLLDAGASLSWTETFEHAITNYT